MADFSIFEDPNFTPVALTAAHTHLPHVPTILGDLNLFDPVPIRVGLFAIDVEDGGLSLIDFSLSGAPRGADPDQTVRTRIHAETQRITRTSRISAKEVGSITAFGKTSELEQVASVIAKRQQRLDLALSATFEFHRLNAIQGMVKGVDGRLIYDWYQKIGQSAAASVNFDLGNTSPVKGALRAKCDNLVEQIAESLGGSRTLMTGVAAACGSGFFSKITNHPDVIDAYQAAMKFEDLSGKPADRFMWGGITWVRYGNGVATNSAHLVPLGIPELFQHVMSPPDSFDFLNQPGVDRYSRLIIDRDRGEWVDVEMESHPMFVCARPGVLRTAVTN